MKVGGDILIIPKPKIMYKGQERTHIRDQKLKVGTEIPGNKPKLKEPIKGMTIETEIDKS